MDNINRSLKSKVQKQLKGGASKVENAVLEVSITYFQFVFIPRSNALGVPTKKYFVPGTNTVSAISNLTFPGVLPLWTQFPGASCCAFLAEYHVQIVKSEVQIHGSVNYFGYPVI